MNITLLRINGITKTLLTVGLLINSLCCLHISMCKNLKYMYNIHCTLCMYSIVSTCLDILQVYHVYTESKWYD